MADSAPTISIRLPPASRKSLDRAVKATRRSRSFLMKEALERYLADIVREEQGQVRRPLEHLLSLAGAGAEHTTLRSAEEIDRHIRWLRDNG
jgi:Arc/MetJ-type ribon-helix-helix transcriptional regulator